MHVILTAVRNLTLYRTFKFSLIARLLKIFYLMTEFILRLQLYQICDLQDVHLVNVICYSQPYPQNIIKSFYTL